VRRAATERETQGEMLSPSREMLSHLRAEVRVLRWAVPVTLAWLLLGLWLWWLQPRSLEELSSDQWPMRACIFFHCGTFILTWFFFWWPFRGGGRPAVPGESQRARRCRLGARWIVGWLCAGLVAVPVILTLNGWPLFRAAVCTQFTSDQDLLGTVRFIPRPAWPWGPLTLAQIYVLGAFALAGPLGLLASDLIIRVTPRRVPLVWKELRESKAALLAAWMWIAATLFAFTLGEPPGWGKVIMVMIIPVFLIAPFAALILLAGTRLLSEHQHRTWDFLMTRPVPLRRVLAAKWGLALALGALFSTLFAAIVVVTMRIAARHGAESPELAWLWAFPAGVVLVQAVLALSDSVNWGTWLTLRWTVMSALAVVLVAALLHGEATPTWIDAAAWLGAAAVALAAAFALAHRFRGEPALREVTIRTRGRALRFASPERAWRWVLWREARSVWLLTALMPLLFLALLLLWPWPEESPGRRMTFAAYAMTVFLMVPLMAVGLGCVGKGVEEIWRARAFTRTLPLPRPPAHRARLMLALGLFLAGSVIVTSPCLLMMRRVGDTGEVHDARLLLSCALPIGLALLPVAFTLVSALPRLGGAIAGVLALLLLTQRVFFEVRVGFHFQGLWWVALALAAVAAWWLAPWLDWRREA
jgi:hypothetical protein